MKKYVLPAGIFAGCYLLFILINLPVSFVLNQVSLPKNVNVYGLTGSVWQAKVKQLQVQQLVLDDVVITPSVLSLLSFDPKIDITFGRPLVSAPNGSLRLSGLPEQVTISDGQINLPAALIAEQANLPIDAQASGNVDITIELFVQGKDICQQLSGNITWFGAQVSAFEQTLPVGDISASLDCQQGKVVASISPNNELGLSFDLVVGLNTISGNGFLLPPANAPQTLNQLLPYLGRPDNQGRYILRL